MKKFLVYMEGKEKPAEIIADYMTSYAPYNGGQWRVRFVQAENGEEREVGIVAGTFFVKEV